MNLQKMSEELSSLGIECVYDEGEYRLYGQTWELYDGFVDTEKILVYINGGESKEDQACGIFIDGSGYIVRDSWDSKKKRFSRTEELVAYVLELLDEIS